MGTLISVNLNSSNVSRASKVTASKDAKTNAAQFSDVDLAMVENQAQEKYIASLVSAKTNQKYTTANWEECLTYLETNYEALKADESIDMNKVDAYITGYQFVRDENNAEEATGTVEEETGANPAIVNGTFDVNKTLAYIAEYYDEYNPASCFDELKYPRMVSIDGWIVRAEYVQGQYIDLSAARGICDDVVIVPDEIPDVETLILPRGGLSLT
jgi:hypothetical protein